MSDTNETRKLFLGIRPRFLVAGAVVLVFALVWVYALPVLRDARVVAEEGETSEQIVEGDQPPTVSADPYLYYGGSAAEPAAVAPEVSKAVSEAAAALEAVKGKVEISGIWNGTVIGTGSDVLPTSKDMLQFVTYGSVFFANEEAAQTALTTINDYYVSQGYVNDSTDPKVLALSRTVELGDPPINDGASNEEIVAGNYSEYKDGMFVLDYQYQSPMIYSSFLPSTEVIKKSEADITFADYAKADADYCTLTPASPLGGWVEGYGCIPGYFKSYAGLTSYIFKPATT